jgi:integrase
MLTDTAIKKAKTTTAKAFKMFDSAGMFLLVTPTGSKLWRLKYRFADKEKLLALGSYPETTLAEARIKRDEARKRIHEGNDPSAMRRAEKLARAATAANSLDAIAREWHSKFTDTWAPSHSDRILRMLERDVLPFIGQRPIAQITAQELLMVLRKIEARGALETAHRARVYTGVILRYAIHTGRCDRDVSADLRGALPPKKGGHFAAVTDPTKLGDLLRALDGYKGSPIVAAALRLAPMLFVRPGELRSARWADIDLEKGEWAFTAKKTDTDRIVPLAPQAVAILLDLQPLTGNGVFVFPNGRSNTRPMSDNAILAALRRLGVPKETASGHGFRASARTILDEVLGFPPHLLEHQLGHEVRDPLGRSYNRTQHLPQRKKMMEDWADYLDKLRADVKVLPFTREAKTAG